VRRGSSVVWATIAAIASGALVSTQTSVNGHVSVEVDSPILATAINHATALVLALIVATATGAFPRARRTLIARRADIRWWWFLGGLMGFVAVFGLILATPEIGVVTVAVAVTLGQLIGSVIADSAGLGPGGRRSLNVLRVVGIVVAVLGITAGSIGRFDPGNLALIPVVVVAGVIVAIQQAANGWLVVVTGEYSVMSVINFSISGVAVGTALLVTNAIDPIDFGATPWWAPIGGAAGVVVGVVIALTVRTIGVLSSMLCVAAGQAISSILFDLVIPVDRIGITAGSVIGAVLAVAAVALAGLGSVPPPRLAFLNPRKTPR